MIADFNMPAFKSVLNGSGRSGKTTFIKRHLTGGFEHKYNPTHGAEVNSLVFNTNRGPIRFNVWDTTGKKDLRGLRETYYIDGQCAIIMFDAASPECYKNVPDWCLDLVRIYETVPIVLCGSRPFSKSLVPVTKCLMKTTYRSFLRTTLPKPVKEEIAKIQKLSSLLITDNLRYGNVDTWGKKNVEKPFLLLARKLMNDATLEFVPMPCPLLPKVPKDSNLKKQMEGRLEEAQRVALSAGGDL